MVLSEAVCPVFLFSLKLWANGIILLWLSLFSSVCCLVRSQTYCMLMFLFPFLFLGWIGWVLWCFFICLLVTCCWSLLGVCGSLHRGRYFFAAPINLLISFCSSDEFVLLLLFKPKERIIFCTMSLFCVWVDSMHVPIVCLDSWPSEFCYPLL